MSSVSADPTSSAPKAGTFDPEQSIEAATRALIAMQQPDGHWVFELEADATIPAEYVLLRHYLAKPIATELEAKIAVYLRRTQGKHGGWPLFPDGAFDMSASVKAYFALKMIGIRSTLRTWRGRGRRFFPAAVPRARMFSRG